MTQPRGDTARIPYDEAICLARIDGNGRLYGRGLDLSASGVSLVSTESCPIGTEIKCDLLLPHGPRSLTGKIVGVTAAPGGFELAVAFGEIKPAVAAVIANLIADRTKQAPPAKLSVDSSTSDGIPRLALDAALDDEKRVRTKRYGMPRSAAVEMAPPPPRLPPVNLPPPCGHPLPSVVITAGLSSGERAIEGRPPRRRVHGTAQIARRPDLAAWALRPATVMATLDPLAATIATERLTTLQVAAWWSRARWIAVPVAAALAVAVVQLHLHLHFGH
jgi:hypothetical protein